MFVSLEEPGHGDLSALSPSLHTVVENHFGAQSRDSLSSLCGVPGDDLFKDGVIVLAFCCSHVLRDFTGV